MCRFSHIFWIDASSEDTIALDLLGLCSHPEAKAAGISVSSQSALMWIASLQSEWLLVFDNADGEVAKKFVPSGSKGNILVTSRYQFLEQVTSYENCLEIDPMAEEEAISLLLKASHLTEQSKNICCITRQIVHELCCLPMAVDQAGASIETGLCSIAQYLEHLSQYRNKLVNHPSFREISQYNRAIYETWDLSFSEIESRAKKKSDGHGRAAAQAAILILGTAAFLHHERIPEAAMGFSKGQHGRLERKVETSINQLLQLGKDQSWNQFFFHEGITVLMSFSLIKQYSTSPAIYAIHPLTHQWSRDRMSISQKKCMMQVSKLILVNCITEGMTAEDIAFNRLLAPHIKANYQSQKEYGFKGVFDVDEYSRFSYVLNENKMWKDVEYLQYQIVQMETRKWGTKHPLTLTSMANLAVTYSKQEKYEEAVKLQLKVLDQHKKVLGPEHPHILTSMNVLAVIYSNQGKYEEAGELELKVMDLHKKVLGSEHLDTLTSMANLAVTYSDQGKYEEAGELELKVLNLLKKILGPEHPDTLTSMANLARTYSVEGRYEEAGELEQKVLDLCERVLGPRHTDTLTTMNNLALIYSKQEKYEEAGQLQLKVLDLCKKVLGQEHPDTLTSMNNLASTYRKQEEYEEAEELYVKVLNMRKRVLGPEHPDTLTSMANLIATYSNQGKYDKAADLQLKILNLRKKNAGVRRSMHHGKHE
jgi:tetratricopeptide (TPR) repeat protein